MNHPVMETKLKICAGIVIGELPGYILINVQQKSRGPGIEMVHFKDRKLRSPLRA